MKTFFRLFTVFLLIFTFVINALPCGPAYLMPLFDYKKAPEDPFENFAAGRIGIIKNTYHRSVLFTAFRYVNGGSFSAEEQKALVEVWQADFNNKSYDTDDTAEAVKKWVEKRKDVVGKEEKTPQIYVEREYGGYDFFPNCTTSSFETATATLSDRVASNGAEDKNVKDWVKAQDQVFTNCASGRQLPAEASAEMPEWLQKDRAYQLAAAEFYSLNYEEAKRRFSEIAQDFQSPWRETAEYLVGRTLIRQASLAKSQEKANEYYAEAEQKLQNLASGHKFADSAERLLGLIKYRLRPQDRAVELGQKLSYQSGNANFRQDLIDYTWLLDKFEKEGLETEEKRREAEKPQENETNSMSTAANMSAPSNTASANTLSSGTKKNEDDLQIYLYTDDYQRNWTFFVDKDATDEDALAEAEKVIGTHLTEEMKKRVREARQSAYQNRFTSNRPSEYEGGYYGSVERSLSFVPEFLRRDELTDWLFAYQINNPESYLYALSKYRQSNSELWLMTALSKADKNSTELKNLLEAAERANRSSASYPTIAYHLSRLYLELGKNSEAKKILDEMLNSSSDLPISTVNQFLDLRVKLAETMDEFFKYSLRKPFAFDMDGQTGTIEEFIAEQKTWYDPKYEEKSREEYEKEVEERFKDEKLWQDRAMFDSDTINIINQHFPMSVMLEAVKSEALPEYLKETFVMAIWTKAVILEDYATVKKVEPEFVKYHPEFQAEIDKINLAKTPVQKKDAYFYFVLKNPILSPFIEDSMGKGDNETGSFDADDWWCAPYDVEYDETTGEEVPAKLPTRPKFLTEAQSKTSQAERKKLKDLGDAPNFFVNRVLEWQKRAPTDKRIPESLFIVWEANGWKKYSCGNNLELQAQLAELLKTRYPNSEWTRKLSEEPQ